MTFEHLSDDELMASLHDLCLDARRLDARVVAHLVEVEERRLHLKVACSSLFDFCVRRLQMSEGAAFRRINAARLARRHPSLLGHIESGAVHLSTLVLLRDHLAVSNVEELVAATSGKKKRDVEELLARRAPRPDTPSTIRKLPMSVTKNSPPPSLSGTPSVSPPPPPPPPSSSSSSSPPPSLSLSPPSHESLSRGVASANSAARPAARIEPLSESRYRVQLTVSRELREKLERARDLMRHRNPDGDLAVVVERALDALVEKLERERLGKTSHPRRVPRTTKKGRVTAAVRDEVFTRDGEQCTYVDTRGRRCPSRAFLELDHLESRALGGPDDAANLRVVCRAHNRLHAEEVFGRKCVERGIHFRQRKSELAPAIAPSPTPPTAATPSSPR